MATKRVLVTGASGFIGQHLVLALVRAGYQVRAIVRRPTSFPEPVDVVVADLTSAICWNTIVSGVDVIVHLAGLAHVDRRERPYGDHNHVNWAITNKLAGAAAAANIERFLYISSVRAQVGASATQTVREQDEPEPTDFYGRSKLAAEFALRGAGVPFTILRPVAVYGPNAKGNVQSLARLASLPIPLPLAGLQNRRSLLGIDNLISAILFVLNCEAAVGQTYLVADQRSYSVPEIVATLRKASGRRLNLIRVPPEILRLVLILVGKKSIWRRLGEDLVVDTSKLQALGWRATADIYDGLGRNAHARQREPSIRS